MLINVITGLYCIEFTHLNFGPFFQNMIAQCVLFFLKCHGVDV